MATVNDLACYKGSDFAQELQGKYQIALTHAQTAALRAGGYVYDVWRTNPGSERVMSIGRLDVVQEVLYP